MVEQENKTIQYKFINNKNRVKVKRHVFSVYSVPSTVKYLEDMAAKGWLLYKVKRERFYFKEIEPCYVKFDIQLFAMDLHKEKFLDMTSSEIKTEFLKKGWNYICQEDNIQYFYTLQQDSLPIERDNKNILSRITKKYIIEDFAIYLILGVLFFGISIIMGIDYGNRQSLKQIIIDMLKENFMIYILIGCEILLRYIKYKMFINLNKEKSYKINYIPTKQARILRIIENILIVGCIIGIIISYAFIDMEKAKNIVDVLLMTTVFRGLFVLLEDKK